MSLLQNAGVLFVGFCLVLGCQTGTDPVLHGRPADIDGGALGDGATSGAPDGSSSGSLDGGDCVRTAPSRACGLFTQCGCPATEACDIVAVATGSVGCVVAGTGKARAPCNAAGACAKGLTCWQGTCHALCPELGLDCAAPNAGACEEDGVFPNVQACLSACDLRSSNPCGGGLTAAGPVICVPYGARTDCVQGGSGAAADPCVKYTDCGVGLGCVDDGAGTKCRPWCRVAFGSSDCAGAGACTGFSPPLTVSGVAFGACL